MSVITLGGGDPFQHRFLPDLVRLAKESGLIVHIDTNGIALRETSENYRLIESGVDLLGLPLDGSDEMLHGTMRSSPRHFRLVMEKLKWLDGLRAKIKLNTIVTAVNASRLGDLADLVGALQPARWSIYQYWPLSMGAAVWEKHALGDATFRAATGPLATFERLSSIHVEVNSQACRRLTYPFVSHTGELYVHSAVSPRDYEPLGSIFDDAVVAELKRRCGPERSNAQSRYIKPAE